MKKLLLPYILIIALSASLSGCRDKATEQNPPEIAVTNSYLQCVVEDLLEGQTDILCLAPPGMCPGHFDISPAQVNQLCKCRVLFLFEFQEQLDGSLQRIKEKGLKTACVRALPGLCIPETYLATCRDVCNILSAEYPDRKTRLNQRLKLIEKRLENLTKKITSKMKQPGIKSAKVISSCHQADFAKWLGLEVVATFISSDAETVSNINKCLEEARKNKIRFVIANKQEGTALAEALAERLGAKSIVFSNFPAADSGRNNFDELLLKNVHTLLGAPK